MYPHIARYNEMWSKGGVDRPLVILIGGYAGTGKSTLAKQLASHFPHSTILQTAVLRSLMRLSISKESNPFLHVHTYELSDVDVGKRQIPLIEKYETQVQPVTAFINELINFAGTEKQQRIIEGAQILPRLLHPSSFVISTEMYLKVSDVERHKRTIAGPTHNRTLTPEQFTDGRMIHDHIVEQAQSMGKEVYEIDEAYDKAMAHIDSVLEDFSRTARE